MTTATRTYRDTGRAKTPGRDLALFLLAMFPLMALSGWGIATLWGWFVPPITGWPVISVWHGYGLALLGGIVRGIKSDTDTDPITTIVSLLFGVPLFVGLGWVVHALAF